MHLCAVSLFMVCCTSENVYVCMNEHGLTGANPGAGALVYMYVFCMSAFAVCVLGVCQFVYLGCTWETHMHACLLKGCGA